VHTLIILQITRQPTFPPKITQFTGSKKMMHQVHTTSPKKRTTVIKRLVAEIIHEEKKYEQGHTYRDCTMQLTMIELFLGLTRLRLCKLS
jgi:hypothetical protein